MAIIILLVFLITLAIFIIAMIASNVASKEDYAFLTMDKDGDLAIVDGGGNLVVDEVSGALKSTGHFNVNGDLIVSGEVNGVTISPGEVNGVNIGSGGVNGVAIGGNKVGGVTLENSQITANKIQVTGSDTGDTTAGIYYVGSNPLLTIQLPWRQAKSSANDEMNHAWTVHSIGSMGTSDYINNMNQIYLHPTNWAVNYITFIPESYESPTLRGIDTNKNHATHFFAVLKFSSVTSYLNIVQSDRSFVDSTRSTGIDGVNLDNLIGTVDGWQGNNLNITGRTGGSIRVNKFSPVWPQTVVFPPLEVNRDEYVMLFSKVLEDVDQYPEFSLIMHGYQRP
jgi:hypothetical protein